MLISKKYCNFAALFKLWFKVQLFGRNSVVPFVLAVLLFIAPFYTCAEGYFNRLDLGLVLGTDGIGLDLTFPVGDYVQLRAGFNYLPPFKKNMTFEAQLGDTYEPKYDEFGNLVEGRRFDKMAAMMEDISGYKIDDQIDMKAEAKMYNGKFIVDVLPFKNKHWYFSAGVYVGPKTVAYAYNITEDMPSLMGMSMYNRIYDKILNEEPIVTYNGSGIELPPAICEKILSYGKMSVPIGDYNGKEEKYRMVPNEEGMVKAWVKTKSIVKPYVGVGYQTALSQNGRVNFACNIGVLAWGKLQCVTHDGTDLVNDVTNVRGQVGEYVKVINGMVVYPMVNLTFSARLFEK